MDTEQNQQEPQVAEVALKCTCPPSCIHCPKGKKEACMWDHSQCGKKIFINNQGDLYCHQSQCEPFFIQNAAFYCNKFSAGYKYRSVSEFLMALAQGLQAAEYGLTELELQRFTKTLMDSVKQKWMK